MTTLSRFSIVHARLGIVLAALAFFAFSGVAVAGKGSDDPASGFVQRMGDKALTSLTAKDITGAVRAQRVRTLLRENFDIQSIGRFVMGPSWRDASASQKSQYMDLFEDMIVGTYARRFAEYSGQSFEVTGSSSLSDSDSLVKSKITQKDSGSPVLVDWRVRNKGGSLKVIDVVVEDISMSMTQRSDFSAVIQQSGIDGLIKTLKERAGKAKK